MSNNSQSEEKLTLNSIEASQSAFSFVDWASDNPSSLAAYVAICIGVGTLGGGVSIGRRVRLYISHIFNVFSLCQ